MTTSPEPANKNTTTPNEAAPLGAPAEDWRSEKKISKISLKWSILGSAFFCVVGFVGYLWIMADLSSQNSQSMREIRDELYPVQAKLLAARSKLELIHHELQNAAITGEQEAIERAEPLVFQFRREMISALMLNQAHEPVITAIINNFDSYYSNASTLARDMLSPFEDFERLQARGKASTQEYEALVDAVKRFQFEQNDAFVSAIQSVTSRADSAFQQAVMTGIFAIVVVLGITAFLMKNLLNRIHAIVLSLKNIALFEGDLSVRIPLTGRDEMTELAHWFNTFLSKLEDMTTRSTNEIKRIAYTDNLSGLPNRRKLMECLEQELLHARKNHDYFAVYFLDLDNFKPINDQYGHEAGDRLIRMVAERLSLVMRGSDPIDILNEESTRAGNTIVGRLGGDEFMVLEPKVHNQYLAARSAEKMLKAVLEPYDFDNFEWSAGVSIGISLFPRDAQEHGEIIDCADMAMYDAKAHGKNTYRFYDSAIAAKANRSNMIESALSGGLSNEDFSLLYQPKYALKDGEYVGAEALLRWYHRELGMVSPHEFITLAEKSRSIYQIDEWVFDRVCAQIRAWKDIGFDPGMIAVNVSAKQIQRSDLIEVLKAINAPHGIGFHCIEFEITETSALNNLDQVQENIMAIRSLGAKVSMDDFGAGHSSLKLLIRCQIDELKIDRSLIDQLQTDHRSRSIVSSIINLANTLGISTVAEGIESLEQVELLREIRCATGQGYFLAKPMLPDALLEHLDWSSSSDSRKQAS